MLNIQLLLKRHFKTNRSILKRNIHLNTLHFDEHFSELMIRHPPIHCIQPSLGMLIGK